MYGCLFNKAKKVNHILLFLAQSRLILDSCRAILHNRGRIGTHTRFPSACRKHTFEVESTIPSDPTSVNGQSNGIRSSLHSYFTHAGPTIHRPYGRRITATTIASASTAPNCKCTSAVRLMPKIKRLRSVAVSTALTLLHSS